MVPAIMTVLSLSICAVRNVALDVLLRHLAHVEATLMALTVKSLSGENLSTAKGMEDCRRPRIHEGMRAEIRRKLDHL